MSLSRILLQKVTLWNTNEADSFECIKKFVRIAKPVQLSIFRYNITPSGLLVFGNFACRIWSYLLVYSKSHWCLYATQSNSDWLFNTQSRVMLADWLILDNNETTTLHFNVHYWQCCDWDSNKPYVEPRPPKSLSFNHPCLKNLGRFWNEQVVCFILQWNVYSRKISWS